MPTLRVHEGGGQLSSPPRPSLTSISTPLLSEGVPVRLETRRRQTVVHARKKPRTRCTSWPPTATGSSLRLITGEDASPAAES